MRGGWGWSPAWFAAADPGPGAIVAHDILEHLEPADGTVERELLALGASLFIRGEGGVFRLLGLGEWASVVHQDITVSYLDALDPNRPLAVWPTVGLPRHECPLSRYAEDQMAEALERSVASLTADGVDEHELAASFGGGARANLLTYMRCGYRRASLVYRDHTPFQVAVAFADLTGAAHDLLLQWAGEDVRLTAKTDRQSLRSELVVEEVPA